MRKLLMHFLQHRARVSLLRQPGVDIHPTAQVNCRAVQYRSGCRLVIGEGSMVQGALVFEREGASIVIGRDSFIGNSILASAGQIEVGDDVQISWGCGIVDHNSHSLAWEQRKNDVKEWYHGRKDWTHVAIRPVRIGNKSWVGFDVVMLKGVELGEGAIVGAGSVVTKSVPPWTIAAGNPAKVIREIPIEER